MLLSAVVLPTIVSLALAAPRPRQDFCDMRACLNDLRIPELPGCEALAADDNVPSSSEVLVEQVLCLRSAYSMFEYASSACEPCMEALGIPDLDFDASEPIKAWPSIIAPSDVDHPMYPAMAAEASLFRAEDQLAKQEALVAEREWRRLRAEYKSGERALSAVQAKTVSDRPHVGHLLRDVLTFGIAHWW
ncbi:hypothetical protein EV122DRAFT_292899 [Schizophyllum commune]